MDWANEPYILVYIRDTGDWLMWGWQTRALLLFLLRKVDRAGVLDLGKGKLRALAKVVEMPEEVLVEALEPLLEDGCVQIRDEKLVIPNFMEAQETSHSDRVRKQMSRERSRAHALSQSVTVGHDASRSVTLASKASNTNLASGSGARAEGEPPEPERPSTVRLKSVPPLPPDIEPSEPAAPVRPPPPTPGSEDAAPGNLGRAGTVASGGSERPVELADRVWRELWQAKYRRPYEGTGKLFGPASEDAVLVRIAEKASVRVGHEEAYLRHKIQAYLRDSGDRNYLAEHCHPLRTLERDWVKYGEPKEPGRLAPRHEEPPVELVSVEEMAARAFAVKTMAKVGTGGT